MRLCGTCGKGNDCKIKLNEDDFCLNWEKVGSWEEYEKRVWKAMDNRDLKTLVVMLKDIKLKA